MAEKEAVEVPTDQEQLSEEEEVVEDGEKKGCEVHLLVLVDQLPKELEALAEDFGGFYQDLRGEQRTRRLLDAQRVEDVRVFLEDLQRRLEIEGNQRRLSDACLDKLSQTRLDIVQQALVHRFQTGLKELHEELDQAKERLGKAEEQLVAAREKNRREVKECRMELNAALDAMQVQIREETKTQLEEDKATELALAKEIKDIQQLVAAAGYVQHDVCDLNKKRIDLLERPGIVKAGQLAIDALFARLDELKAEIAIETEERKTEEDNTAVTLEGFATKLQEGLRIVNKSEY